MRPQGVRIDRVLSRSVMIGSETRVLPVISLGYSSCLTRVSRAQVFTTALQPE